LEREISPSLQEYLTAIYKREGAVKWVRTTDVASDLRVSPASATEAFKRLAEEGYIEYLPYRGVRLTDKGLAAAEAIAGKERALRGALKLMGVPEAEAEKIACLLEHSVSDQAVRAITEFVRRCIGEGGGQG